MVLIGVGIEIVGQAKGKANMMQLSEKWERERFDMI
jgi:hypothetical protein